MSETHSVSLDVVPEKSRLATVSRAPQYRVLLAPQLNAVGFDELPAGLDWQPLTDKPLRWLWEIRPQDVGTQRLFVTLNAWWQPLGKQKSTTLGPMKSRIWEQCTAQVFDVDDPRFVKGSYNISAIVAAVVVASLSLIATSLISLVFKRDSTQSENEAQ
jgi:hypothetical protein